MASKCKICGKPLTDSKSIQRGVGPECYKGVKKQPIEFKKLVKESKPKPKAKPKQRGKNKAKEEFLELLHQQIMENNKELRETIKKLYMAEKDQDRLDRKLDKIEEAIEHNEHLIKERTSSEGIKNWNEHYLTEFNARYKGTNVKSRTLQDVNRLRKQNIKENSEEIDKWNKEIAMPIREKILERKKQTQVLEGQREGLRNNLEYLQGYKANINKAKGETWKAEY